jgi:4-amino-4-deoxy-L-arabinose transferase-like glycosyltransferase
VNLPNELHLLLTIALNGVLWWTSFLFVRRIRSGDRFSCAMDAMLLSFLVQYLSVTIPGLMGQLSASTLIVATLAGCIALYSLSLVLGGEGRGEGPAVPVADQSKIRDRPPLTLTLTLSPEYGGEGTIATACLWLVLGYIGAIAYFGSSAPPLGDDGMIYHLPAAIQWLKTGWIGIYNTWFVNPANTYSPLGGSTFMTFLIAPMGTDIAVRFCQAPALVLIFFAMVELLRGMQVNKSIACLIAAAAVICRPFMSQSFLVKDDLYLAAFFMCFVTGCSRERLTDRVGPWRLGVSLGLLLAVKYTALLALPLLALLIDAPFRARWRFFRWATMLACVFVLAGPWFIRNWIVAGNPLFPIPVAPFGVPIFDGLFTIARSTEMSTWHGVWQAFTGKYHDVSPITLIPLIVLCVAGVAIHAKSLLRDPLKRICLVGSLLGLLIFILASHAAEIRYTYASLLLLFAAVGLLPRWELKTGIGCILLAISLRTVWADDETDYLLAGIALGVAIVAAGLWFITKRFGPRPMEAVIAVAVLYLGWAIYVYWPAFNIESEKLVGDFWANRYGVQGALWKWTRENLPPDARIATSNTVLPYPLLGRHFTRTVEYIPTRRGLKSYHDLPRGQTKLTDQQIRPWVATMLSADTDEVNWLRELERGQFDFLYIEKQVANPHPIELDLLSQIPHREKVFENEAGVVYRISLR